MNETLYKVLGKNGESVNGGLGRWSLPSGGKPGKPKPPKKPPKSVPGPPKPVPVPEPEPL